MKLSMSKRAILGSTAVVLGVAMGPAIAFAATNHGKAGHGTDAVGMKASANESWGHGHKGARGHAGFGAGAGMLGSIATDLHVTPATLSSDLKAGKTVAEIATAENIAPSTIISDLEASAQTRLSGLVTSGKLTSAQEQTMLSHMDTRIADFVNGTHPVGPRAGWSGNSSTSASATATTSATTTVS